MYLILRLGHWHLEVYNRNIQANTFAVSIKFQQHISIKIFKGQVNKVFKGCSKVLYLSIYLSNNTKPTSL